VADSVTAPINQPMFDALVNMAWNIGAEAFRGRSRLDIHRAINAALADEIAAGLHALAIEAKADEINFVLVAGEGFGRRNQGMSPQDIYNTFAGTQEAENYNAINEIYRQNLGRDVDQEGLKYWSDMMSKGNIDPEALGQIVSGSQEAKNYDNTEFIKDEYSGLLGKEPSQEELSKAIIL
jgi:hypothetical protein